MSIAYKNFWSLNIDEAIVTGILRKYLPRDLSIFMPMSAQMKDIDLLLANTKSKKVITIQVKGSRAYEPRRIELSRYRNGSAGWFFLKRTTITKCKADYFIFLIYVLEEYAKVGRRTIAPHILTVPAMEFKKQCQKHKKAMKGDRYNFLFWIDPLTKSAFDIYVKDKAFELSKYLDQRGISELRKRL
ncbi:MAG: hypothetical protein A2Z88_10870 [Omnitrophica WOR_2 bacterium GWA2_47_8]|nr:MAG: hypothetical protein A2Z88_10870 [Omnitrophica WOR_2 bacterium GWA2_47_8]